MKNITACIPEKGLLREYLDYAEPLTGAPIVYHLFVGLTVLAVTVANMKIGVRPHFGP